MQLLVRGEPTLYMLKSEVYQVQPLVDLSAFMTCHGEKMTCRDRHIPPHHPDSVGKTKL